MSFYSVLSILNFTLHAEMRNHISKPQPNIQFVETFNGLCQELAEIGDWQGLCLVLNVDEATVDGLRHSNQRSEEKKRECLHAYYNSGEATWEGVITAITKHPIKNCRLAKKIALKYSIKSPC